MSASNGKLSAGTDLDPALAEALAEITDRLNAGASVDVAAYAARLPGRGDELRRLVDALRLLDHTGPAAAAADVDAPAAGGVLGDFRVLREVGRGGMGVVYEAEQLSLQRRVALKVLPFAATMDPRQLQRFANEARAAASLHHEHIVPVHGVGQERGVHFYAMQFVDGRPLSALIDELRRSAGVAAADSQAPTGSFAAAPSAPTKPAAALSTQKGFGDKA